MRALPLAGLVFIVAAPAWGESLQVSGKAGYLSEWEVTGTVTRASGARTEYSGPLILKHVGICSINGAAEKTGEIRLRISRFITSRITATLRVDGRDCTYRGPLSDADGGTMDCGDGSAVPLSLSVK